jgi:hypothetical protein
MAGLARDCQRSDRAPIPSSKVPTIKCFGLIDRRTGSIFGEQKKGMVAQFQSLLAITVPLKNAPCPFPGSDGPGPARSAPAGIDRQCDRGMSPSRSPCGPGGRSWVESDRGSGADRIKTAMWEFGRMRFHAVWTDVP